MPNKKRLFVFAGFDKDNIVDDTVIYYVNALSGLGDVIFIADTDLSENEIKKISKIPNVLYAGGVRHGEYDFGSYKRGYLWAKEHKILKNYDWLYFVNDSVYGPLHDLTPILKNLETSDADLIGMTANHDNGVPLHVQSWFVGFGRQVFTATFFDRFIKNITHLPNKRSIVFKYEAGLSCLIMRHGFKMNVLLSPESNTVFDDPRPALVDGLPFVKKNMVSRLRKLYFLYPYMDDDVLLDYIVAHMARHNVKMVKDSFRDVYDLRLFGIPLLRITAKKSNVYKVYLFGHILILKITKN